MSNTIIWNSYQCSFEQFIFLYIILYILSVNLRYKKTSIILIVTNEGETFCFTTTKT
jgi:hypothetical protein